MMPIITEGSIQMITDMNIRWQKEAAARGDHEEVARLQKVLDERAARKVAREKEG
jgi:hypothetical protein